MNDWIGLPDDLDNEEYLGFIYVITNTTTNRKYIGKKQLWSTTRKPPLKGKKRKRVVVKPSDYLTYHGSSEELKADIELNGTDHYKREVLAMTTCKWEAAWLELLYQLKYNVILSDEYLNGILNIRLIKIPKGMREKYKNFKLDFSLNSDILGA